MIHVLLNLEDECRKNVKLLANTANTPVATEIPTIILVFYGQYLITLKPLIPLTSQC